MTPPGFREIRDQAVGGIGGLGELLALEKRGRLEEERLVGIGVLGGEGFVRERDGFFELAGAHFRLDLRKPEGRPWRESRR